MTTKGNCFTKNSGQWSNQGNGKNPFELFPNQSHWIGSRCCLHREFNTVNIVRKKDTFNLSVIGILFVH